MTPSFPVRRCVAAFAVHWLWASVAWTADVDAGDVAQINLGTSP